MKCKIPSFVSEFVQVDQWVANDGTIYTVGDDYGRRRRCDLVTVLTYEPGRRASVSPPRSNFNVSFPFPERTNSDGTKGKRDTTRIQSRCHFSALCFTGFVCRVHVLWVDARCSGPAILRDEGHRRVRLARQHGNLEVSRTQLCGRFRRRDRVVGCRGWIHVLREQPRRKGYFSRLDYGEHI